MKTEIIIAAQRIWMPRSILGQLYVPLSWPQKYQKFLKKKTTKTIIKEPHVSGIVYEMEQKQMFSLGRLTFIGAFPSTRSVLALWPPSSISFSFIARSLSPGLFASRS